jgi:hypothetical protein
MDVYLLIVILLGILAITDLVVGVSGKSTQIDPLNPNETDPPFPFQIDPLFPAEIDPLKNG